MTEAELKKSQEKIYRNLVLAHANMTTDKKGFVQVSKEEYDKHVEANVSGHMRQGDTFYVFKDIPSNVSDEEFLKVEEGLSHEVRAELKKKAFEANASTIRETASEENGQRSFATVFFTVLAFILWFIGIILGIINAQVVRTDGFAAFMATFIVYLLSGCLFLCAAELFKKLQTIINLLKKLSR